MSQRPPTNFRVETRPIAEDGFEYKTDRGELRMWCPAPYLLASRLTGHLTVELASCISSFSERRFAVHFKLEGFHDWELLSDYDTDARVQLTRWVIQFRSRMQGLHFLMRSKFGVLGLSVANMALGGLIKPYAHRIQFEQALRGAVKDPPSWTKEG
jgi:hypothetical protein